MNQSYVVVKSFQDKTTGEYYGMGESYQAENGQRAAELEQKGYIALENSQQAQYAMESRNQSGAMQGMNQTNAQNAQNAEAYTIVNGKRVSLKQAQAGMEAQEANVTKTGIQQAHDNHTEPVQAGQTAKSQTDQTAQLAEQYNLQSVRQANVQSGQQALEQHMQQAQQQQAQQAQGQAQGQTPSQALTNQTAFNEAVQNNPTAQDIQARAKAATKTAEAEAKAKREK
jgi:hypothetical protein